MAEDVAIGRSPAASIQEAVSGAWRWPECRVGQAVAGEGAEEKLWRPMGTAARQSAQRRQGG